MANLLALARVLNVLYQNRKAEAALIASVVSIVAQVVSAWH